MKGPGTSLQRRPTAADRRPHQRPGPCQRTAMERP